MAEYIVYRHGWNDANQSPAQGLPLKMPVARVEAGSRELARLLGTSGLDAGHGHLLGQALRGALVGVVPPVAVNNVLCHGRPSSLDASSSEWGTGSKGPPGRVFRAERPRCQLTSFAFLMPPEGEPLPHPGHASCMWFPPRTCQGG